MRLSLPEPWGRLVWPAAMLAAGISTGLIWRDALLGWLQAPLQATLLYTKVGAGGFALQAGLTVGMLFVLPALAYHLVVYLRPVPRRHRLAGLVAQSGVLVVAGVLAAYYVALPLTLDFLGAIRVQQLHPLIAADSYLSFVLNYVAVFAAAFQLPALAEYVDPTPAEMRRWRPWVDVGALAAALILPVAPDPISQVLLALPVIVLFEISYWLVVISRLGRDRPRRRVALPSTPPPPSQQRLPMAIAVPHRPKPQPPAQPSRRPQSMEPIGSKGPAVIDMRPKR